MFEVRTNSPFSDDFQERDEKIFAAAGRQSDFSGAGVGPNACAGRDHGWHVKTFAEAQEMKRRLDALPNVTVTIREK
jgi:hypothetical protein